MELTPEQKAGVAAGESLAVTAATAFNPAIGASLQAIAALTNAMLTQGPAMTMDDFNAALGLDAVAAADELAAQTEATAAAKK